MMGSTLTFILRGNTKSPSYFHAPKNKRNHPIFAVAYHHGFRTSEDGMLQRTDMDIKVTRITINRVKGSMFGIYPNIAGYRKTHPLPTSSASLTVSAHALD